MNVISATGARKDFFKLLERASHPGYVQYITVGGDSLVVMMSADEFEGWMETLEIMSDPKMVKGIKEGKEDVKRGRVVPWEKVRAEMIKREQKERKLVKK